MKKTLRFSLLVLFAIFGMGCTMAGTIDFSKLNLENEKQYLTPFDGGDFTVVFAGGKNVGKYFDTGKGIRVYGGDSMIIKAKSGLLTKIKITYDGSYKPTSDDVVNTGSYNTSTGVWTGSASEVIFTRPSGTGHWRVQAIATNDDVDVSDIPTEGQTPETAITVDRALTIIDGLGKGEKTKYQYYVKGTVTSVSRITTSNATFYLGDLQAYNLKGLANSSTITDTEFIKTNDEVVVCGCLQKFVDKSENIIREVSDGYVYSVNGSTQPGANPEDAIKDGTTKDEPMSVSDALGYIKTFSNNFITTKQYYVSGKVTEITEISTVDGNATFKISNATSNSPRANRADGESLVVYRVKGLGNNKIETADYIKVGDEVVIFAKLQNYNGTPELSSGNIYKLNGATGIAGITTDTDVNAPMYSLDGRRVDANYHGVVIKNGKKMVIK